jgi:hypothetical protein
MVLKLVFSRLVSFLLIMILLVTLQPVQAGTRQRFTLPIDPSDFPSPSFPSSASSPELTYAWAKTWGGGTVNVSHMAVDRSGNLYICGDFSGTLVDFDPDPLKTDIHSSFNGSIDAFLSKFDASGKFLWAKTWGGQDRDVAYGVGVDSSDNAYVVGPYRYSVDFNPDPALVDVHTSNYPGENNIYVSKFAPNGTFQWVRTWGPAPVEGHISMGGEAYTVAVSGNNLYVVGDFSGGTTDFNPWGSHDWHTNHPPASGPIFFDAFLSKFDLNGNLVWARTWGGEGYDDGPGVAVDSQGSIYVAGMYASQTINFDPAGGSTGLNHPASDSGIQVDVFLSKFDSSGNFQWVRTWGGPGTEEASGAVAVDSSNNVYITGRFGCNPACNFNAGPSAQTDPDPRQSNGDEGVFLSKYNSSGDYQWTRTWGGNGKDMPGGVTVDGWGDLYVPGWFQNTVDFNPGSATDNHTSNGLSDAFLSRLDSNGNFLWAGAWGGSGNENVSVADDGWGNIYAGGSFAGTVDFDPGPGVDSHTALGSQGAFVSKFTVILFPSHIYLPSIMR